MGMNRRFLKRRYFDFRAGNANLSPILSFGNFLMLAYLTINEVIPLYIFAPLFVISILVTFTIVGSYFRKVQISTDVNMLYEKKTEAAKTSYEVMRLVHAIAHKNDVTVPNSYLTRMKYVKKISEGMI